MEKENSKKYKWIEPYKGIIIFLFLLFFFHYSWKITVDNDGSTVSPIIEKIKHTIGVYQTDDRPQFEPNRMYFWGKDVTPDWFETLEIWLTEAAAGFVRLNPGQNDLLTDGIRLYFPNPRITIVIEWGCLGLKQMAIFACIILFFPGVFLRKLWFIPFGCFILTLYNIVRIGTTVILTRDDPSRFQSLHDGILRYIYYIILFLLWVSWADYFGKKKR